MQTRYKIDFDTAISGNEEKEILRSIVGRGGNGWLQQVLRDKDIKGRTKIVDSFRYDTHYQWTGGSYKTIKKSGRTKQDQDESLDKMLDNLPAEEWINLFVEQFSLNDASYCIVRGIAEASGIQVHSWYAAKNATGLPPIRYNIEVEIT